MTELVIAVAPMHRLCKKAGVDRVSEAAAKELANVLEEIGVKIAKEALDYVCMPEEKPLKRKTLRSLLEKSWENSNLISAQGEHTGRNKGCSGDTSLWQGCKSTPRLSNLFFIGLKNLNRNQNEYLDKL